MTQITLEEAKEQQNDDRSPKIVAQSLNILENKWRDVFANLAQEFAPRYARQIERMATAQLRRALEAGGIPTFPFIMTKKVEDALELIIEENVNLIKSIPEQYFTQVKSIVYEGVSRGGDQHHIVTQLRKQTGITQRRAVIIARDQTTKAFSKINVLRCQERGMTQGIWIHSGGGAKPRPLHVKANGTVFDLDKGLPIADDGRDTLPGMEINCLPGNSLVNAANVCRKIFKRAWCGELTQIITDDGFTIEATPNHPVLTDRGWLAVKLINKGDNIFKTGLQASTIVKANIHNMVPTFEQLFGTLANFGYAANTTSTFLKFHGDISDNKVSIIDMNRLLAFELNRLSNEHIRELFFACTGSADFSGTVPRNSALFSMFSTIFSTSDSIIRRLCALLTLLKSKPSCARDIRLALCSALNSLAVQYTCNDRTTYFEKFRDTLFAFSTDIALSDFLMRQATGMIARTTLGGDDKVQSAEAISKGVFTNVKKLGDSVERLGFECHPVRVKDIGIRQFEGHVYNLESEKNWYVAQDTIYHNCRCTFKPITALDKRYWDARS